jgi:hypothetical protein
MSWSPAVAVVATAASLPDRAPAVAAGGAAAMGVARSVGGVERVVRVFEYRD